jgi:serine/threonine protein phosphatase 1
MAPPEVAQRFFGPGRRSGEADVARAPEDAVVYAVGDVHGCDELLAALLEQLASDAREREPGLRHDLIFLGDYIDRGPDSRRAIDHVLAAMADPLWTVTALKGNHEDALLRFLDDPSRWPVWADYGASSTLLSYGVPPPTPQDGPEVWAEARDRLEAAMPLDHIELMRTLALTAEREDYFFVHAGVRPHVPLDQQTERDLLWIREDFMRRPAAFEKVIVHGHTPAEAIIGDGRIALDTVAYATGALSAIKLKDANQILFQARGPALLPTTRPSGHHNRPGGRKERRRFGWLADWFGKARDESGRPSPPD